MAAIRTRWRSERGAEVIEFAIVAPILIFIIAGVIDFGMMLRAYEVVTNAAREGARVGVLPGYDPPDVQARVNAYFTASGLTGARTTTVTNLPVPTPAGTFTARSVNVQYVHQWAVLGAAAPLFGGNFGTITLGAVSVMRTEVQAAP